MTPYKNFTNAAKDYFNSVPFLKFLLTFNMLVFGAGGFFYLVGAFVMVAASFVSTIGIILMYAGLLLTLIKEDIMTLIITSGIIALGSLIAFIITLISFGGYGYGYVAWVGRGWFEPFFYFLAFGAIVALVMIKSEKFKQIRAASAAKAQATAGVACPNCGAFIPSSSAFCPNCGAPNTIGQQPVPPAAPQAAPPVQPQAAPPQAPQAAPQAPPAAPPVQPAASAPEQSAAPAGAKCVSCGADLPPGAVFCGKCGAKQ